MHATPRWLMIFAPNHKAAWFWFESLKLKGCRVSRAHVRVPSDATQVIGLEPEVVATVCLPGYDENPNVGRAFDALLWRCQTKGAKTRAIPCIAEAAEINEIFFGRKHGQEQEALSAQ